MIIWKHLLVLLLLLSLLSVPIFSDVVLTDEEAEELEATLTELETLLEEQGMEYELLRMQLAGVSQEIIELKKSLSEAELSLSELEKEQIKKTMAWVVGSLIAGAVAGVILE